MQRKSVAKNKSELAAYLAKLDGSRIGISRQDARDILKLMESLETALIVCGYKSACMVIRRKAVKKAKKLKQMKVKR